MKNIHLPKDKVTGMHQGYGFVEFKYEHDAEYAMKVMNMVKVFGKPIRVNKATQNGKVEDIGANIFIGEYFERRLSMIQTLDHCGGHESTDCVEACDRNTCRQPRRERGREVTVRYVFCLRRDCYHAASYAGPGDRRFEELRVCVV